MEAGAFDHSRSQDTSQAGWRLSLGRALRTRAYWIFSDEALVLRARARDYRAFETLVSRYRDRLFTMALTSLGSQEKATEALSEAVLSAFRDIDSFDAKSTPGTWLYLHGLRAVFRRMNAPLGRYAYTAESRPTAGATSRGGD